MPKDSSFDFYSKKTDCKLIDNTYFCIVPERGIERYITKPSDIAWGEISGDSFIHCHPLPEGGRVCASTHIKLIERPIRLTEGPSFFNKLGSSALWGIGTTVLPEVLGDYLHINGYINRRTADRINALIHIIILFLLLVFSDSPNQNFQFLLITAGLNIIIERALLKCFVVSPSAAEKLADLLSFTLTTAYRSPSSDAMLTSATGFAAGSIGLWVEKKMVEHGPLLLDLIAMA